MSAPQLVDIATALTTRSKPITVVGLVVDYLDIKQTGKFSTCITFTIKDAHWDTHVQSHSLKIRYFHGNETYLPPICLHDVILIRNLKVMVRGGQTLGVAFDREEVPWTIFRSPEPGALPDSISGPFPFEPTASEKKAVSSILASFRLHQPGSSTGSGNALAEPPSRPQVVQSSSTTKRFGGLPFTLIKDAQPSRFGQFMGQVVKDNDFDSEKVILWITDYTPNDSLKEFAKEDEDIGMEGDPHGYLGRKYAKQWPGPWGKMSVQVTLWEPHASYARQNVKPGNIVLLTYVRPKDNGLGEIEFAVSQDRKFPEKVHIQSISPDYDEHARELMKRRKEYWKIHGNPKAEEKQPASPEKHTKKKQVTETKKKDKLEEDQLLLPATSSRVKSNENVRYPNNSIPLRSLESILDAETHINSLPGGVTYKLPFQNVSYLMQARVVDYFPPNLEDFAVEVPNKSILGNDDYMDTDSPYSKSWEWRFCLLLEGIDPIINKHQRREQMKVFVSGPEGEHLLDLSPADLRRDANCLSELREKLFILWGNLEECKVAATTSSALEPPKILSRPFTCSIKEYGVPCSHSRDPNSMAIDEGICGQDECLGWERRFAIAGTTIKS